MNTQYDFAVIGTGGIGSGTAYWLSKLAAGKVVAFEQFDLGHGNGGSQDHSRIIRLSYHDPNYVAIAPAAYDCWAELEADTGLKLVHETGGLDLERCGTSGLKDLDHCSRALTEFGIEHELLSGHEIRYRWPQFNVDESIHGIYQRRGGLVDAAKANAAHQIIARANGVTIVPRCPVRHISGDGEGVRIETDLERYEVQRAIIACGAWTNNLVEALGFRWPLTVTQEQVTYYQTAKLQDFALDRFPVWIWRAAQGFYGFPVYGEVATKAGQDAGGHEVTAESRTWEPDRDRIDRLNAFLDEIIPGYRGPELLTKTCLYTMPPDRHFIIDFVPGQPNIVVAVGAGHAFKFASVIGRILTELATSGESTLSIESFRANRPALTDPAFKPIFRNEDLLEDKTL